MGLLEPVPLDPPSSIANFAQDIIAAARGAQNDHQEALRRCARLVWSTCNDRSWDKVQAALEAQGAKFVTAPIRGQVWTALPSAYRSPDGTCYDLEINCSIGQRIRWVPQGSNAMVPKYEGPSVIVRAEAALRGNPRRTTSSLLASAQFPGGEAVDLCLRSDEFGRAIPLDWPIDVLNIAYEPIQPVSPFHTSIGYMIRVEAHDPSEPGATTTRSFQVVAHTDPAPIFNAPLTWLMPPPEFQPTSELGPVEGWGGSSSWPLGYTPPTTPPKQRP